MDRPPFDPEERVFLVRMRAVTARSGVVWRGSVTEVIAGVRRYVTGPAEIADFIATRLLAGRHDTED